jgi:hypothetical protein
MKSILFSSIVLGASLFASPVQASNDFEASSRWFSQGRWASSSAGIAVDAGFWMDLRIGAPNERGTSQVSGFLGTPWGSVPVLVGYYIGDARRLSLVYEQNSQTKIYIRGHISEDSRMYGAEVFASLQSTTEAALRDVQTQALRREWGMAAGIADDQILRSLGSVSAWAR